MDSLNNYIHFIQEAEGLKCMTRTAWTSTGRRESTAEHSWRLALLAGLLLPAYPGLDARPAMRSTIPPGRLRMRQMMQHRPCPVCGIVNTRKL